MARGVQKDAVLAVLSAADVLAYLKIEGRERRGELRTRTCPACGTWGRDAIAINLRTGQWKDHAHGCHGDLLDAIAAAAGLDLRRDFGRVLEIAAVIAGVTADTDPAELARMRADRARLADQRAAEERRARARAVERAAFLWRKLGRHHDRGADYLTGRGLEAAELERRNLVRYNLAGDPVVALRNAIGEVINVVTRWIDPGDGPKVTGLADAPTMGTLVMSIRKLPVRGVATTITEGVADTLAAALAWPGEVVIGAHGADNMPAIAKHAAHRLARGPELLRIVPHRDRPTPRAPEGVGRQAANRGRAEAIAAGLGADLVDLVELGDYKDLADAFRAGWRPTTSRAA